VTRALNALAIGVLIISLLARNPLLFLVAVLLGLVTGASALWDRYALARVTYHRQLGVARLFPGEETELTLEIVNAKPLPLAWLRIDDEFPGEIELLRGKLLYSHQPGRRMLSTLTSLRFYDRVRRRYRLKARQRGALEFGPAELRSGDMFGFRYQQQRLDHRDLLIVYPKVVPVTALGLPASHPFGDAKTARKLSEDPLRVTSVRPYVPGDSPRLIHWKATARRGELQTKVFDPSASRVSAIFLDMRTVEGFPGIVGDYLELAITTAASVAGYILEAREPVGLYANGARRGQHELIRLPASRRPGQWTEILETLAWASSLAWTPLEHVLRAEAGTLPFGALVIVVSPVISEGLLAALLDMRAAGHPTVLLAIGEEPPTDVPGELTVHWIGGHEAWERLDQLDLGQDTTRGAAPEETPPAEVFAADASAANAPVTVSGGVS
jgi:uncharacterized protein (DUF58 family)